MGLNFQQNICFHIGNIHQDKELDEEGTHKKSLLVRQEGKRQVERFYPFISFFLLFSGFLYIFRDFFRNFAL